MGVGREGKLGVSCRQIMRPALIIDEFPMLLLNDSN